MPLTGQSAFVAHVRAQIEALDVPDATVMHARSQSPSPGQVPGLHPQSTSVTQLRVHWPRMHSATSFPEVTRAQSCCVLQAPPMPGPEEHEAAATAATKKLAKAILRLMIGG